MKEAMVVVLSSLWMEELGGVNSLLSLLLSLIAKEGFQNYHSSHRTPCFHLGGVVMQESAHPALTLNSMK